MTKKITAASVSRFMHMLFPFVAWLRTYDLLSLRKDMGAGLTVALVLVPQSMANAQLAGLPAYHGLYAALLPTLIGGLWGSSKQMVTGTVAVTCLMASAALQPLVIDSPAGYVAHMALLTLLVGVIQLGLGLVRLGIVVNFLSLPVISGFTNAAAFIIIASQLGKLLGITVEPREHLYETVLATCSSAWNYVHLPSLLMASLAVLVFYLCKRFAPKAPAVLLAVLLTTLLSWAFSFENNTTVHVSDIASDEARILLVRLTRQEQEIARLSKEIVQLEAVSEDSSADISLEREYKIEEKRLIREHVQQNMVLVREHLQRMLFMAEEKTDGTRTFYMKESPRLILQPKTVIPRVETGNVEHTTVQGLALPSVEVQESQLPADAFSDGKTWRIRLGKRAPQLDSLEFYSGGAVVGTIAKGLPQLQAPEFSFDLLMTLFPSALIIAFIAFAESISIGKAAASLREYRLDANQELVGQGLANIAGAFSMTPPVSGSFSNSAVNLAAGARTGLASAVASCITLLILLFFTGILRYLPQPVLAVVVMRAALSLLRPKQFFEAWQAQYADGVIAVITFGATLFFAPHLDNAIAIGVILSLAAFFYRTMRPVICTLACGTSGTLQDARAFGLEECRHIAIIQFQGPLFFASANVLENTLLDRLETDRELRHIHLVCSGITHMDASGEDALETLVQRAYAAGVGMSFSGVVGSVYDMMARTGLLELMGAENIYHSPREAVCAIYKQIQHDANCPFCPLSALLCPMSQDNEKKCAHSSQCMGDQPCL